MVCFDTLTERDSPAGVKALARRESCLPLLRRGLLQRVTTDPR